MLQNMSWCIIDLGLIFFFFWRCKCWVVGSRGPKRSDKSVSLKCDIGWPLHRLEGVFSGKVLKILLRQERGKALTRRVWQRVQDQYLEHIIEYFTVKTHFRVTASLLILFIPLWAGHSAAPRCEYTLHLSLYTVKPIVATHRLYRPETFLNLITSEP